jgi:hypothetical protein
MDAKLEPGLDEILAAYDDRAPLAEAFTIPGRWYTDPRVAERERQTVFARGWLMAARADQLAAPGQYATCEIAG